MTLFKRFYATLAAVLLGGAIASAPVAATTMEDIMIRGKIIVAVQTQGVPISFVNSRGERTGLAIELVKMMAADAGLEVEFVDYDWKGLIPALLSGKADFIAGDMTPTAKRATQLTFSIPIFYTENIAYSVKDRNFTSWSDLNDASIKIGATQASTYSDVAKRFMPEAELKEFGSGGAQVVEAVISGRVDAGVSDTGSIRSSLEAFPQLMVLDGVLSREPLAFPTRPESTHLLEFINNYIRLVEHDGRLGQMVHYWWETNDWKADN